MKNWSVIGGIAAALAASVYVLWGPITERKKRRKGEGDQVGSLGAWALRFVPPPTQIRPFPQFGVGLSSALADLLIRLVLPRDEEHRSALLIP